VNDVHDDDVFPHLHTGPFDLDSVDSLSDIGSISSRRRHCTNGSSSGTKILVKFRNENPHFHDVVLRWEGRRVVLCWEGKKSVFWVRV
jgi:hypothetical protein